MRPEPAVGVIGDSKDRHEFHPRSDTRRLFKVGAAAKILRTVIGCSPERSDIDPATFTDK